MGNTESNRKEESYDVKSDPCNSQLQAYLACVKSYENGLSEGADCMPETMEYKKCRSDANASASGKAKTSSKGAEQKN